MISPGYRNYPVTIDDSPTKEELRKEIDKDIALFLQRGGKIKVQEIETGRNPELFPKSRANNKTSVY